MKTIKMIVTLLGVIIGHHLSAIQEFDIRFLRDGLNCEDNTVCYLVQLRSSDGQGWNLAGQNYRIYYDATKATYQTGSGISLLPDNRYSSILFTADIQDVDASAFGGDLPFASNLSFLNYSIDLMNLSNGGINLPANGEWVSTSRLCFDVPQSVIDNPSECLNMVWARMGKTDQYATAFVEVSQWISTNSTTEAIADEYDDLDENDGVEACLSSDCDGGENENTDPTCSDGIDNDQDGLIDCADPDCDDTTPCAPPQNAYDLRLQLNSVDCVSGMACYLVQIRSNADNFTLGGQSYSLYYDSEVGEYASAVSRLDNAVFEPLALQSGTPVEHQSAVGVGPLPYEDDLGFIQFNIALSDLQNGSGELIEAVRFTTTAEVCWTMTSDAINNPATCFSTTWGRSGVTDSYNAFFTVLEEWEGPQDTRELLGDEYFDVNSSSGNDACFDTSCGGVEETGDPLCTDGIDNDDDGLVDCQDPGCSQIPTCLASCSAQAPTITKG